MKAMPSACASREFCGAISLPSNSIRPASFWWMPPRMFMVVDLPDPFSPTRPRTRPRCNSRPPARSTFTPKKLLPGSWMRRRASLIPSSPLEHAVTQRVGHRREENDRALDRIDCRQREAEKLQPVVDDAEQQHAEQDALR